MCINVSFRKIWPALFLLHLAVSSCSGDQFAAWQQETFEVTAVTESTQKIIYIKNTSADKEQHVRSIAFDKGSNADGNFTLNSVKTGDQTVGKKDIVVPPGSSLALIVTYSPVNLETTYANYGGWETGKPKPWLPGPAEDVSNNEEEEEAIHRALLLASYDYPKDGLVQIELVGIAVPGPEGEISTGGDTPGECSPGGGTACYTGGFAVDIPELYSTGPKELELTGSVKFNISGGEISLRMDDFPPAFIVLGSDEVPKLPSGVTITLIISGSSGATATGTFDGSRITLNEVSFRVRIALSERTAEEITAGGLAYEVDFDISNLEITTTEPLAQSMITMHLETTLPDKPSGNDLFDQYLSGANVILIMQGELLY